VSEFGRGLHKSYIKIDHLKKYYHLLKKNLYQKRVALRGHMGYGKFIIICRSRTGSSLLKSLLDHHPEIACSGEIFKTLQGKDTHTVWNQFFNKKPKNIKQVGCKIFYYHPLDGGTEVWDLIERDSEIKIIHLIRKNRLSALVSQKIGEKTKLWSENVDRPHGLNLDEKRISLDFEECKNTFQKISNYEEHTRRAFSNHPYTEIYYENLAEDPISTAYELYEFLGLSKKEVVVKNKKQNPEKLSELIMNYEDLKQQFLGTPWEVHFEN